MKNIIALTVKFIVWFGLFGSLLSVTSEFSSNHLFFDLLSNFRVQYIVLIPGVLVVALLSGKRGVAVVLSACMLVHLNAVANAWRPITEEQKGNGPVVRVMVSNLLASNTDYENQIAYIKSIDPDIVVFPEYTPVWGQVLEAALIEYTYKVSVPLDNPFGIAMLSKIPLLEQQILYLEHSARPSVAATVSVGAHQVAIFGTHPPPPMTGDWYDERNRHLQKIAALSKRSARPFVVLGDLNITPWSSHFKKFLAEGGLVDSRRGNKILPTWPAFVPVLQIPIDHIIVNDAIKVNQIGTSKRLKSDHHALWADLQLRQ